MDRRSWLWKRKSSEKCPGETESSGSVSFISGRFSDGQWNEIRKTNINLPIIGKAAVESKEEFDADGEEDDPDNVEESEGDEFEQETG